MPKKQYSAFRVIPANATAFSGVIPAEEVRNNPESTFADHVQSVFAGLDDVLGKAGLTNRDMLKVTISISAENESHAKGRFEIFRTLWEEWLKDVPEHLLPARSTYPEISFLAGGALVEVTIDAAAPCGE